MALSGFILLHRSMLDWEWYSDFAVKDVFLHLLLTARFQSGRWQGTQLAPGQAVIGTQSLAEALGISRQQVRTALRKLVSTGEISTAPTSKFTLVTIRNWQDYQSPWADKQPADNHNPTNQKPQRNNDHNDIKREEGNTLPDEAAADFEAFWAEYPRKEAKKRAYAAFAKGYQKELLEGMLAALRRQRQSDSWTKENGRFIPYAARWLAERRWEDEEEHTRGREQYLEDSENRTLAVTRF